MANGLGGFTSALGQFFTGMGQDQQNAAAAQERQQQLAMQQQAAQRAEALQQAQIGNYQSEAAQRAAVAQREEQKRAIIAQHAQKALAGDQQSIAAIASVAPEMLATLTKPEPAPRNIDPLSPEGLAAQERLERTRASLRPERDPSGLSPQQANQTRLTQSALLNMRQALKALQDAVQEGGMAVMPGEYQSKINSLQSNAMIQFKEAANLGAISGPDMALIQEALGSATSPMQLARGGKKGVLASLETAQQSLTDRANTLKSVYGVDMPKSFYDSQQAAAPPAPAMAPSSRKPLPPRVQPQQGNAPRGNVTLGDDPIMAKFGLAPKKGGH